MNKMADYLGFAARTPLTYQHQSRLVILLRRQDLFNRTGKLRQAKRLGEKSDVLSRPNPIFQRLFGITGHAEHFDPRHDGSGGGDNRRPIHLGHHHIEQDQIHPGA